MRRVGDIRNGDWIGMLVNEINGRNFANRVRVAIQNKKEREEREEGKGVREGLK